jgi:hypothetical protein
MSSSARRKPRWYDSAEELSELSAMYLQDSFTIGSCIKKCVRDLSILSSRSCFNKLPGAPVGPDISVVIKHEAQKRLSGRPRPPLFLRIVEVDRSPKMSVLSIRMSSNSRLIVASGHSVTLPAMPPGVCPSPCRFCCTPRLNTITHRRVESGFGEQVALKTGRSSSRPQATWTVDSPIQTKSTAYAFLISQPSIRSVRIPTAR